MVQPRFIESYEPPKNESVFAFADDVDGGWYIVMKRWDANLKFHTIQNYVREIYRGSVGVSCHQTVPHCDCYIIKCSILDPTVSNVSATLKLSALKHGDATKECQVIAVLPSYHSTDAQSAVSPKPTAQVSDVQAAVIKSSQRQTISNDKRWFVATIGAMKAYMFRIISLAVPDLVFHSADAGMTHSIT